MIHWWHGHLGEDLPVDRSLAKLRLIDPMRASRQCLSRLSVRYGAGHAALSDRSQCFRLADGYQQNKAEYAPACQNSEQRCH